MTAILAAPLFGGLGLAKGMTMGSQLWVQFVGVLVVGVWSVLVSWIVVMAVKATTPIRVIEEDETEGLDITIHGERGYHY